MAKCPLFKPNLNNPLRCLQKFPRFSLIRHYSLLPTAGSVTMACKPMHKTVGQHCHILSRLRVGNTLFALPTERQEHQLGRTRKYGQKMGNAATLAGEFRQRAITYSVNLYGKQRDVVVLIASLCCRHSNVPYASFGSIEDHNGLHSLLPTLSFVSQRLSNTTVHVGKSKPLSKRSSRKSVAQKAKPETVMLSPIISTFV